MSRDRSARDKAHASWMKEHGVKRTTMSCPICHYSIGVGATILLRHLMQCKGRQRVKRVA